jgi:hypothetical protein
MVFNPRFKSLPEMKWNAAPRMRIKGIFQRDQKRMLKALIHRMFARALSSVAAPVGKAIIYHILVPRIEANTLYAPDTRCTQSSL